MARNARLWIETGAALIVTPVILILGAPKLALVGGPVPFLVFVAWAVWSALLLVVIGRWVRGV